MEKATIASPFDQSWQTYAQSSTQLQKHRDKFPNRDCKFLQRVLTVPTSSEGVDLKMIIYEIHLLSISTVHTNSSYLKELCSSFLTSKDRRRTYLVHLPPFDFVLSSDSIELATRKASSKENLKVVPPSLPVVILLPGTDESCFDCEYVIS